MGRMTEITLTCMASAYATICLSAPSHAQTPQFYANKQISIYVGFSPGAGFDLFARMVARYLGDHIPGNPTVIVRNMAGAGGATVVNYTLQSLPKDGTAITLVNPVMSTASFLQPESAKWDAREFTWLGSPNSEINYCIFWEQSQIRNFEDLATANRPLNMAGVGVSGVTLDALTIKNVTGWNWNMVMGYPGLADVVTAGERGEIDGSCGLTASTLKTRLAEDIKDDKVRVLLATSTLDHPDFPRAQSAYAFAKTPEQRDVMDLVFGPWKFGRPFMVPPGVPADRTMTLTKALLDVTSDRRMIEEAKTLGFDLGFVSADDIRKLVAGFYAVPEVVKDKTREIMQVKP